MRIPDPIPVQELLEARGLAPLGLKVLAGRKGLRQRMISNPRIQKPGLALAGYLDYVREGRIQVVGQSEVSYLGTLDPQEADRRMVALASTEIAAILIAKGLEPSSGVVDYCDSVGMPLLGTAVQTSEAIARISNFLEERLAPWTQIHGVLVEVFSVGTLITGAPGIGKSECALELVYRGHRLVADDLVVVRRVRHSELKGSAHPDLEYMLELRGVGIIDIRSHFGNSATSLEVDVNLSIHLEKFEGPGSPKKGSWRDRLRLSEDPSSTTHEILGIAIPRFSMAVAPGRDVAIMVETAVRKCLLAERGIHDEEAFLQRVDIRAANGHEGKDRDGEV